MTSTTYCTPRNLRGAVAAAALLTLAAPGLASAQVTSPEVLAPAGPYAQHVTTPAREAAIVAGRKMIADYMAKRGVPGLAIAISVNNTMVWSEGFGLADVEQGVPVTPSTRFRTGSTAKPLPPYCTTRASSTSTPRCRR